MNNISKMKQRFDKIVYRTAATQAKDVFEMNTSTKQVDKAYKLMSEALMILRKFQGALAVKKIKQKVNTETNSDIDGLIDGIDKVTDKVLQYSIKLAILKEKQN